MPSSGSGTATGTIDSAALTTSVVQISIRDVILATGLSPKLFALERQADLDALIEEHIPVVRRRIRRRVGSALFTSTDLDVSHSIQEAITYMLGARVLRAAMIQGAMGVGPPLLRADAKTIQALIDSLMQEASDACDDAQIETPTDEPEKKSTSWASIDEDGVEAIFTREDDW